MQERQRRRSHQYPTENVIRGAQPDATLELEYTGRLALAELITHLVPAAQAPEMFTMLDTQPESALQVVLDYRAEH